MKCFSTVLRRFKFLEILFAMAVIFINIVIAPYSGYQLQKGINSPDEIKPLVANHPQNHHMELTYEDLYHNNRLNMSKETQETIYTDILHIIRAAQKISNKKETSRKKKLSLAPKKVPSSNSTNSNYKKSKSLISQSHSKPPNFHSNTLKVSKPLEMADKSANSQKYSSTGSTEQQLSQNVGNSTTEDMSSDSTDNGYLLGYSSNMFGSHTEYIEHMSFTSEVPRHVEQLPSGKLENATVPYQSGRKKRSVVHLYNMVLCATGCNPLSYKGYGCYCGFLGSGYVVDGIDSCCKMHDWCYDTAGCPMFLEYFIPYYWKCYHHRPLCALDHGGYGGPGSCAQRLCECDKQLALCLRRYPCPSTKAICTSSPWRLLQNIFML